MQDVYQSGAYEDNNPTWHEEDADWKAAQIVRLLKRHGFAGRTICEVGCGTGNILLNLESAFPNARLSGYEISPHAFQRAASKETERTRFYLSDLLAEKDLVFDLVLIIDVIEHVEDYIAFVRSIRRYGGLKVFHIPLDLSAQSVLRNWPMMKLRRDVGHLHYFTRDSALATLTDCGYRIIDHCYTASRLELPDQVLTSRLMKLPRRLCYKLSADLTVRALGGYSLLVLAE